MPAHQVANDGRVAPAAARRGAPHRKFLRFSPQFGMPHAKPRADPFCFSSQFGMPNYARWVFNPLRVPCFSRTGPVCFSRSAAPFLAASHRPHQGTSLGPFPILFGIWHAKFRTMGVRPPAQRIEECCAGSAFGSRQIWHAKFETMALDPLASLRDSPCLPYLACRWPAPSIVPFSRAILASPRPSR